MTKTILGILFSDSIPAWIKWIVGLAVLAVFLTWLIRPPHWWDGQDT